MVRKSNRQTHGQSYTKTYGVWAGMKRRCYNPKEKSYKNYGGRGIKVCERWKISFENFLQDMGQVLDGTSIERRDVNGDYCPENCCWATQMAQGRNRRNSVLVMFNGMLMALGEVSEITGVAYSSLYARNKKGMPLLEKAKLGPTQATKHKSIIVHEGKKMSLTELAKHTGINYQTLWKRHKIGHPIVEGSDGRHKVDVNNKITVEYRGNRVSLRKLSELTGIKYGTLHDRLHNGRPLLQNAR